jgi:hypothetical protein
MPIAPSAPTEPTLAEAGTDPKRTLDVTDRPTNQGAR